MTMMANNGINLIHLYIWDQDAAVGAGPVSIPGSCALGSPPVVPSSCTYAGFVGEDDGGPASSPQSPWSNPSKTQWTALSDFVSRAKTHGIWVTVHFDATRPNVELSMGPPSSSMCYGSSMLGTCLGDEYAAWVNSFIDALAPSENVLAWGINYGVGGPSSSTGIYADFWQEAYSSILNEVDAKAYSSPTRRALIMVESGFQGIWPHQWGAVQPILSLFPWTYPSPGNWYSATGYQWNWTEAPPPIIDPPSPPSTQNVLSVQDGVNGWAANFITPDLWAIQAYGASSADLEAALECIDGSSSSLPSQCSTPPLTTIPFSKMMIAEVATGTSLESAPIGNGFASRIDAQTPLTTAAGQAQWLQNTLCVFSRHGIPAFAWHGLYDSASWWEANFNYSGPNLAVDGYFGLASEIPSSGNKAAWTAFLNYPSSCPSGTLPTAPVLGLYADAPYYTQGDTGVINYTAGDVSSLSLNESPASDIFSCETADDIAPSTTLVGSCSSLVVQMTNTTSQITLSGSNQDVENSVSGSTTYGSASTSVTVGSQPVVEGIQDYNSGLSCDFTLNPSCVLTANQGDILIVYGKGFTLNGGNTINLTGPANLWLYETDGYYYWDGSRTQINAQLGCYVPSGSWTLSVWNPYNGNPSAGHSINIVSHSCP